MNKQNNLIMLNTFSFCQYGDVETHLIDKDVEIPTIEIVGYIKLDEITADEMEAFDKKQLK